MEEEEKNEAEEKKKEKKEEEEKKEGEESFEFHINTDSEAEIESHRKRIKHKKGEIKHRLPKLIDTSRGAFEKFQEEQRLKRAKNKEEAILERERVKKFFHEINRLRQLSDDAFDEYIREQLAKLNRKKGEANDEIIRINEFLYQILTNLAKDKNKKQKFNFLSPVSFKDKLIIDEEGNESSFENDTEDNNVLITTTFLKKTENKDKDN